MGRERPNDGRDDQVAIRALVDSYAAFADERDVDRFVGLFLPDATLSASRGDGQPTVYAGAARLAEIPERLQRFHHTFHDVGYQRCEIRGDRATGEAGCRAHHVRIADGAAIDLVMTIRYRDAYSRTPDGWRFASREVHILWTSEHPVTLP